MRRLNRGYIQDMILMYAPTFCWCSLKDLFMIAEQIDENVDFFCFEQAILRLKKRGVLQVKPGAHPVHGGRSVGMFMLKEEYRI